MMSSSSLSGEAVDVPCPEVTLILTFSPASDALTGMHKVLVSSETDSMIGTSNGVDTDDVVGVVESVKMGNTKGWRYEEEKFQQNSLVVEVGWMKSEL